MLKKLYIKLVTRNENVRATYTRYKKLHPRLHDKARILSWIYLICLILKFSVFKQKPNLKYPEAGTEKQPSIDYINEKIKQADVISFDVFDTLVLRKTNTPSDVFSILSVKTGMINFRDLRISAEKSARFVASKEKGTPEITIYDIYDCFPSIPFSERPYYMEQEFQIEKSLCYANPYLKQAYDIAVASGKPVIATSDMYWPKLQIKELLHHCGYDRFDNIFVSNEFNKGKYNGELQKIVSSHYPNKKILHIGDNAKADYLATSKNKNFYAIFYKNIMLDGMVYRPKFASGAGSVYQALVNAFLHCGIKPENPYFEFGYTYGGFLSYGYCQYIDRLASHKGNSKILFTARDSLAFYEIYKKHFDNFPSEYFYCSREALLKACLPYSSDIFFDIMFMAKTRLEEKISIKEALIRTELGFLQKYFADFNLNDNDLLTIETVYKLQDLFYVHLNEIVDSYKNHHNAALAYVRNAVKGYPSVFVVDLGWRGTVYALIKHLINLVDPTINVYGTEIGSTRSPIPVALIDSSWLKPYSFSHVENTDLQIKFEHVMLVETLFSSEQASTVGYKFDKNNNPVPIFGNSENKNSTVFNELKKGIYKFCDDFNQVEKNIGIQLNISGREGYLPLHTINKSYSYMISLFGKLNATDMSASKAYSLKSILKRYGYNKVN